MCCVGVSQGAHEHSRIVEAEAVVFFVIQQLSFTSSPWWKFRRNKKKLTRISSHRRRFSRSQKRARTHTHTGGTDECCAAAFDSKRALLLPGTCRRGDDNRAGPRKARERRGEERGAPPTLPLFHVSSSVMAVSSFSFASSSSLPLLSPPSEGESRPRLLTEEKMVFTMVLHLTSLLF